MPEHSLTAAGEISRFALNALGLALAALYLPLFWEFSQGLWRNGEQAHAPLILGIAGWLLYRAWPAARHATRGRSGWLAALGGWMLLLTGLALYIIGRTQGIEFIAAASLPLVLAGCVLALLGPRAFAILWFPLFFLLFMVPLPGLLVAAVTMPMKLAVSFCAEWLLYAAHLPVARTGVILQVGQYQLLVADACAGLHTLFTLEALGLLYLNLVRHESVTRNAVLAALIVPISFSANVIRVIVLSLVTYFLGDAAGQGFLHGFAGLVLFVAGLLLVIAADSLIRRLIVSAPQHRSERAR